MIDEDWESIMEEESIIRQTSEIDTKKQMQRTNEIGCQRDKTKK